MYVSPSQKRIGGTLLVGAAIVAGAIMIRSVQHNPTSTAATAADGVVVTSAPTRQALPEPDSNHDGVPDWQEALVETTPLTLSSSSTPYTQPDTLTGQFSQTLMTDILQNKMNGAFGASQAEIASSTSQSLLRKAQDVLLTEKDITISTDTSQAALSRYGELVAQIMNSGTDTSNQNEALILQNAIQHQDEQALHQLDGKIQQYQHFLDATKALAVPASVTKEHLDLLNSYQAILNDIKAMRNAFQDPTLALLRLKRYRDDATGLYNAISNLYTVLVNNGATWPANSAVYSIIQIKQ